MIGFNSLKSQKVLYYKNKPLRRAPKFLFVWLAYLPGFRIVIEHTKVKLLYTSLDIRR